MPRTLKPHAIPRTKHYKDHLPNCETCGKKPGRKSVQLGCSNCRKLLCINCRTQPVSSKDNALRQGAPPSAATQPARAAENFSPREDGGARVLRQVGERVRRAISDAEVDSPVLAITDEQLHEMRRSGQKLPARVSWVLVPTRPGRKIDDTFEVFQSQCKRWDTTIEYQQYTQSSGNSKEEDDLTGFMLLEDFFARVTERGQHTELQRIEAEGKDPVNVLSLSAEITGSAFREPEAITTLRYRLLSVLSKRSIGHSTETGVGKLSVQPVRLVDQEACLKFLLYGERGSFAGYPHGCAQRNLGPVQDRAEIVAGLLWSMG
ncbi:uncharacterized protein CC84DRAFT_1238632 [Paraphaeosphaeria sporulosa]|uniref:Uncharacterized protein n=1 Tax=Paraphaeosphaeria sporulosa TaxID=1460663 RepID=A0A177BTK1_9PLEO|nr:uncharacterized protein CC84DRAFT_1238632 [Paraphaeosphaeria sporulosa]OAF98475.1 hypothetical protein CC84DRAFT_1238632 [Paraphaeosphaeria sporulosa]